MSLSERLHDKHPDTYIRVKIKFFLKLQNKTKIELKQVFLFNNLWFKQVSVAKFIAFFFARVRLKFLINFFSQLK